MRRCRKYLIPEPVPGIVLAPDGVCNLCVDGRVRQSEAVEAEAARLRYQEDFVKALADCRGQGEYDCLVPLSGGKDSVYLLYRLKVECRLKVLAFTLDINIPALAWQNIRRALSKLDIDHISYSPAPAFYEKTFRYLLRNQEARGAVYTVSYVYAPLFEGDALRLAIEKGIGIGVDYAIYLYGHMRDALRAGASLHAALTDALRQRGSAIAFTALTMAAGVALWAWAPLKLQADMGILLAFMFLASLAGALVLLPALAARTLQTLSPSQPTG